MARDRTPPHDRICEHIFSSKSPPVEVKQFASRLSSRVDSTGGPTHIFTCETCIKIAKKKMYPIEYTFSLSFHTLNPSCPPALPPTYTLLPTSPARSVGVCHRSRTLRAKQPCNPCLRTKSPDTMAESATSEWRNLLLRNSAKTRRCVPSGFVPLRSRSRAAQGRRLSQHSYANSLDREPHRTGLVHCFIPFVHSAVYTLSCEHATLQLQSDQNERSTTSQNCVFILLSFIDDYMRRQQLRNTPPNNSRGNSAAER